MIFQDKTVLITGGTGSLGRGLVRRIMTGEQGKPERVIIFSRDEDKQYAMELEWQNLSAATDDVFYNADKRLSFRIGDVRDYLSLARAVKEADIIIHAAAMRKPIISTRLPGMVEEFGENNGIVYVDRPEEILEKAVDLVKQGTLSHLGARAREFVEGRSWDNATNMFENFLVEAVRNKTQENL